MILTFNKNEKCSEILYYVDNYGITRRLEIPEDAITTFDMQWPYVDDLLLYGNEIQYSIYYSIENINAKNYYRILSSCRNSVNLVIGCKNEQIRRHRKKRINKKYAKLYGYKGHTIICHNMRIYEHNQPVCTTDKTKNYVTFICHGIEQLNNCPFI